MKETTQRDGDALDILARRFKEAGEDGQVNGGDLVELVGELLESTGRSQTYTRATRANMEAVAAKFPDRICTALGIISEEEYSASAGDYFTMTGDDCLKDSGCEEMILVFKSTSYTDALTGEAI